MPPFTLEQLKSVTTKAEEHQKQIDKLTTAKELLANPQNNHLVKETANSLGLTSSLVAEVLIIGLKQEINLIKHEQDLVISSLKVN